MKKPLLALIALIVLLGGGFLAYQFLIDEDTQEAATLGETPLVSNTSGSTGDAATPNGTWNVIKANTVFAGYRIGKTIGGQEQTVTGRTGDVTGSVTIAEAMLTSATFEVNTTTITTNSSIRDSRMKNEGLETSKFPTASLKVTAPTALGAIAKGQTVAIDVPGELNLHGTTKAVTIAVNARWNGETLDLTATTPIVLSDYGMTPPAVPGATVADRGEIEAQLAFGR